MPTKTVKKSTKKAALTVAEYRAVLGNDAKKKITVQLKPSDLTGSIAEITKRINKKAGSSEIEGEFTLVYSTPRSQYRRNPHSYGGSYVTVGGPRIEGFRPYSDAEIEKNGASLLAAKVKRDEKAERARSANIVKFNKLAEALGYEPISDTEQ